MTTATAILAASLITAVASPLGLAFTRGQARLRETAVYFVVRHLADKVGLDLLGASPLLVNRPVDLHDPVTFLHFAGETAITGIALLAVPGVLFALFLLLVSASFRARPALRGRFDTWRPALLVVVLLAPLLGVAANGLLHVFFAVSYRIERVATYATAILFSCILLAAMRRLGEERLQRTMRAAAVVLGVTLAVSAAVPARRVVLAPRPAPRAGAPNIVLISIDTLRADHVHCYGYGQETTPNLDRFSREGALFREAISPTSWTLPAHLTMLTSLPPEQHGVIRDGMRLDPAVPTLAQVLRERGYDTAGFVSGAYLEGEFGFAKGFDEYDDYSVVRLAGVGASRQVSSPTIAKLALDYLARRSAAKTVRPFFLFLHFYDVHAGYMPHAGFTDRFAGGPPGSLAQQIGLYDGEIAWTDHYVGTVLDELRRRGLLDRSVVAITSDHGEEFLDHGGHGHRQTLYDEVIHVPLLMRYPPRIPSGTEIDKQVRTMDLMPTLISLAGLRWNVADQSGRDLSPLFDAKTAAAFPSLTAFGDLEGRLASVRTPETKFIENRKAAHEELYDLQRDPHERQNLIGTSTAAASLRTDLARWRTFCDARRAGVESVQLVEEQKRTLRSLGYIQ